MRKNLLISMCCFALASPVMAEDAEEDDVQVSVQEEQEEFSEIEEELPETTESEKDSGWSFSKWFRDKNN